MKEIDTSRSSRVPRLVSIIMPCYKMGEFVGDALKSIGQQTHQEWELIAVDDCAPEDGTSDRINEFARLFPKHRIEWIRQNVNKGVSAARNTAIDSARGELLAFLDPDDFWLPEHLARAVAAFGGTDGPDVVTAPVVVFYRGDLNDGGLWPIEPWKIKMFPASLACHNFIQPSATLIRRKVFDTVSPFTTEPEFQHVEDYDLWIRLAKAGIKFEFLDGASCYYRKHAGAATADPSRMLVLDELLTRKHIGFFVQMHSLLLVSVTGEFARSHSALSGPAFRPLIAMNRIMRNLKRKFSSILTRFVRE